jgi:hypothetical protein
MLKDWGSCWGGLGCEFLWGIEIDGLRGREAGLALARMGYIRCLGRGSGWDLDNTSWAVGRLFAYFAIFCRRDWRGFLSFMVGGFLSSYLALR